MPNSRLAPYSSAHQWDAPFPVDQTLTRIIAEIEREKGRIDSRGERGVVARLGSRFRLRMYGLSQREPAQSLPVRVQIELKDAGVSTSVEVTMRSDEGWYLFRLPRLADHYQASFASRAAALQNATTV